MPEQLTPDSYMQSLTPDQYMASHSGEDAFNSFGPSPAAKVAFGIGKLLNPAPTIDAIRNPVESYHGIVNAMDAQREKAKDAFAGGDYLGAGGHAAASLLPIFGPTAADIGEKFATDPWSATGETIGLAAPLAFNALRPESTPGTNVNPVAAKMYQSALKPPPGSYDLAEVKSMVGTGLKEGIPVSDTGVRKLDASLADLHSQANDVVATNPTAPVNKYAVTRRLLDTYKKFQTQVSPTADLAAIDAVRDDFLNTQPNQIAAQDAQALKSGTYQQLKDRAYGELKSGTVEAQKALARGLKEEVNNIFPELRPIQANESDQYELRPALERAVRRISNHDILSLSTYLAGAVGSEAMGHPGLAGAFGSGLLVKVLGDPAVKSRLAIALNQASNNKLGAAAVASRIASVYQGFNQAGQQAGTVPPTSTLEPQAPTVSPYPALRSLLGH